MLLLLLSLLDLAKLEEKLDFFNKHGGSSIGEGTFVAT